MAAAAYQVEEEDLWKCPKHPSKRRRTGGVCPFCLRDRLVTLCPNCGNPRPCPCLPSASSSSSSSSSSFGGDHSLNRSRSLAFPFLRSSTSSTSSFLSVFRRSKTKKKIDGGDSISNDGDRLESNEKIDDFAKMITRSRSVGVGAPSVFRLADVSSSAAKTKFWQFHRSKNPKAIVQDRSPLHRG